VQKLWSPSLWGASDMKAWTQGIALFTSIAGDVLGWLGYSLHICPTIMHVQQGGLQGRLFGA
jgi:hypothetical protein